LSLYFALVTPLGVGVYWTMGNLLGIASTLILNLIYSPKKLAGEALLQIKASRKTGKREEKQKNRELRIRENRDATRFKQAKKRLVFYAISGGQYKYYKNIIEYLLEQSNITIHYLTNDPADAVFKNNKERLEVYYASERKTISLMLKLDTDIFATTVPDLQNYYMKRSIVRDDIEYIYIPHALVGSHISARERAFDHFDTFFLVGMQRIDDLRYREKVAGLAKKKLVTVGYGFYDQLISFYANMSTNINKKPKILIAPSWQDKNILELCITDMIDSLQDENYEVIVRPHPQFVRMFPERIEDLRKQYPKTVFETDFSDTQSTLYSDILITDWSNIAFEFSFCTLKPCIFINTPMKILNQNYGDYGIDVPYITLRDEIGISLDLEDINCIGNVVSKLLSEKEFYRNKIELIVGEYLYNSGRSGEAGGRYILSQLNEKRL